MWKDPECHLSYFLSCEVLMEYQGLCDIKLWEIYIDSVYLELKYRNMLQITKEKNLSNLIKFVW